MPPPRPRRVTAVSKPAAPTKARAREASAPPGAARPAKASPEPPTTKAPRPARRPRAEQKSDKRTKIREAAWQLFSTVGYEETTTKEVAALAGVASGTLFLYATDKPDLLFLVMHERLARTVEEGFLSMPRHARLVEQILHVFAGVFAMYGEHPAVAAAFVRALPGARGPNGLDVMAFTGGFLHRIAGLVIAAQERGEVSPEVEPLMAAHSIFGLYLYALSGWLTGLVALESALDPGLRGTLQLLMRGLAR